MSVIIALGRALNVGGRSAPSSELRALFQALGRADARTVLQSGNVLFTGEISEIFRSELEAAFQSRLGYYAQFFLRDAPSWRKMISANPFNEAATIDPKRLLVYALSSEPDPVVAARFAEEWRGPETIAVQGREAYVFYADGVAGSKLTTAVLERRLDVRGTARNWNTINLIASLAAAME